MSEQAVGGQREKLDGSWEVVAIMIMRASGDGPLDQGGSRAGDEKWGLLNIVLSV